MFSEKNDSHFDMKQLYINLVNPSADDDDGGVMFYLFYMFHVFRSRDLQYKHYPVWILDDTNNK